MIESDTISIELTYMSQDKQKRDYLIIWQKWVFYRKVFHYYW